MEAAFVLNTKDGPNHTVNTSVVYVDPGANVLIRSILLSYTMINNSKPCHVRCIVQIVKARDKLRR